MVSPIFEIYPKIPDFFAGGHFCVRVAGRASTEAQRASQKKLRQKSGTLVGKNCSPFCVTNKSEGGGWSVGSRTDPGSRVEHRYFVRPSSMIGCLV